MPKSQLFNNLRLDAGFCPLQRFFGGSEYPGKDYTYDLRDRKRSF